MRLESFIFIWDFSFELLLSRSKSFIHLLYCYYRSFVCFFFWIGVWKNKRCRKRFLYFPFFFYHLFVHIKDTKDKRIRKRIGTPFFPAYIFICVKKCEKICDKVIMINIFYFCLKKKERWKNKKCWAELTREARRWNDFLYLVSWWCQSIGNLRKSFWTWKKNEESE